MLLWIDEGDHIARAANEVNQERARLIGLESGAVTEFPGVADLLVCHTQRDDFTMAIPLDAIDAGQRTRLDDGSEYISEYNRVLSRWWEQERSSCE